MEGGYLFAGLMILVWPLVSIALFVKRPVNQAILCTVLGGLLLLPTYAAIKITMVPALDKSSVPSVCAFIGALVLAQARHKALAQLVAAMRGPVQQANHVHKGAFAGTARTHERHKLTGLYGDTDFV